MPSPIPSAFPTLVTFAPTIDPLESCGEDASVEECSDDVVQNGIVFCFNPDESDFEDVCVPVYAVPLLVVAGLGVCGKLNVGDSLEP